MTNKGCLVVSEVSWLKPDPPEEVKKFWANEYPAIKTIKENLQIARKNGYRLVSYFVLPEKSWWTNYYTPIETKIASLKAKYRDDKKALHLLTYHELEIEMYLNYSDYYGYVFYIIQVK